MKTLTTKLENYYDAKRSVRISLFIILTLIPAVPFYYELLRKLKTRIDMEQTMIASLPNLIYLLLIGIVLAFLFSEYMKNKKQRKETNKAIYDHAIRLNLYSTLLQRMTEHETSKIKYNWISTITDKQKKYLGFDENKVKSEEKFELNMLKNALTVDGEETWQMLIDEFNKNNPTI